MSLLPLAKVCPPLLTPYRSRSSSLGFAIACLTLFLTSCRGGPSQQQAQRWLRWHPALTKTQQRDIQFDYEVLPQSGGIYQLQGRTNLPEGSQLAIAAVRYLTLDLTLDSGTILEGSQLANNLVSLDASSPAADSIEMEASEEQKWEETGLEAVKPPLSNRPKPSLKPTYVILDYQKAEVKAGQWNSQLKLWQVDQEGRYQESWQLHQRELGIALQPEPEIAFLVTILTDGAADRLQDLQNKLAERQLVLSRALIQTSTEGEQYFQSVRRVSAALPQARTTPPPLQVQDINGGWGRRYLLVEQDPLPGTLAFPDERNSDAPGSPQEFIQ